jgi:hypothetical protein
VLPGFQQKHPIFAACRFDLNSFLGEPMKVSFHQSAHPVRLSGPNKGPLEISDRITQSAMPVLSLTQQGHQFFAALAHQLRSRALGRRIRGLAGSDQNRATANEYAQQSGQCREEQLQKRKRLRWAHISSLEMPAMLDNPMASYY